MLALSCKSNEYNELWYFLVIIIIELKRQQQKPRQIKNYRVF